jgi:hypothetical protein
MAQSVECSLEGEMQNMVGKCWLNQCLHRNRQTINIDSSKC